MPPAEQGELRPRHVAAVTLGNALEFYDFLTYAFFAIQIGHAFFPATSAYASLMLSLATFGAGFVTRPIGALVIGAYADRAGRRPAMMLCFVLIGGSILLMAAIPSYDSIGIAAPILAVIARMAQGFSVGGEVGASTAYLAEAAAPARRGFVVSLQGLSQFVAVIAASVVGLVVTSALPASAVASYGWRIAFVLGAAAVPFGLWLRATLPETLPGEAAGALPASRLHLAGRHGRVMVLGLLVIGSGTIATYVQLYVVTYAQDTLHMSARAGFVAEGLINVTSIGAVLLGGWLSDRRGRRPVNLGGNLARLVLIYPAFAWIVATRSPLALVTGMVVLGALLSFHMGAFYAAFSESLPAAIRSSAFGIIYSVSVAVFGGTTQLVITWLIHVTHSALAPAWYMLGATAVAQVALYLFPESAPIRAGK